MNKTSLLPVSALFRMVTLGTVPLITYFGVTEYNKLNKIELPELPIEIEQEPVISPEPQKRIRRVWKQTKGDKFTSWFNSPYKYTDAQLNSICKSSYVYQIFRNWCKQAEFNLEEQEIE